MKRLSILLHSLLIILFACEKDETMMMIKDDGAPPVITSTAAQLGPVITTETLKNEMTIQWNKTDYGLDTEVNYVLELDWGCNSFEQPIVLGTTTSSSFTLTLDALNAKLLTDLKLAQHLPADLQLRITSRIKNQFVKTSEAVAFTITPWRDWSNGLWLLSDEWNDSDAPAIYAAGEDVYDGYVYLNEGDAFKFADTRACGQTLYGRSSGQLSADNAADKIAAETNGYYKVNVDATNMTYSLTKINTWGLIGTATPGGWNTSTAMTYDPATQVWEATVDLVSGALKFRANNDWPINYGPADGSTLNGSLAFDDPGSINIQETGNYTVTIDFSKTKSPDFTYTVKKNQDGQAPATLWVPGDYQGWQPAAAPTIKSVTTSAFEGYIYISTATGYKFTNAPDWDHINYGDSGEAGVLTTDGLANALGLSQAGYYKFNVNVDALTYSAVLINTMGMIGPATLDGTDAGWGQSVAMTYNQAEDVWRATVNLVPGALKFRANNEWTINYGPADSGSLTGTLIFDDPGAVNITEAGSYTVTADFTRSKSPYKYTYKIVKN